MAAEKRFTRTDEINKKDLKRWIYKSRDIQWDYKNLIRRKGEPERIKCIFSGDILSGFEVAEVEIIEEGSIEFSRAEIFIAHEFFMKGDGRFNSLHDKFIQCALHF